MRKHMKLVLLSTTLLALGLGGCISNQQSLSTETAVVESTSSNKFEAEIKAYEKLRLEELLAKAQQGDRIAQYEVGKRYYHGKMMDAQGLPRNYKKAGQWYQKSADQGYGPAWYALAEFYNTRNVNYPSLAGWKHRPEKALECYQKAAEQRYILAQIALGLAYLLGHDAPQNSDKALEWFQAAAEQGDARGQYHLGEMYERGWGVPQDYSKAMEWYQKAADHRDDSLGSSLALTALSKMHEEGKGMPQDYKKAFEYEMHQKTRDYYKLGGMYAEGKGVPQDYKKAIECYLKGANQHDDRAMYELGYIYAEGRLAPKDLQKSKAWYQKSFNIRKRLAMHKVTSSREKGIFWAQYQVGQMYENGLGVVQDQKAALGWYQKAAAYGVKEAQEALKRLEN